MGFLFITAQQTEKLIVPDSIQKAKFAETVEKIANMDLEKVLTNLVSESIWVGLKIVLALAIYMARRTANRLMAQAKASSVTAQAVPFDDEAEEDQER